LYEIEEEGVVDERYREEGREPPSAREKGK